MQRDHCIFKITIGFAISCLFSSYKNARNKPLNKSILIAVWFLQYLFKYSKSFDVILSTFYPLFSAFNTDNFSSGLTVSKVCQRCCEKIFEYVIKSFTVAAEYSITIQRGSAPALEYYIIKVTTIKNTSYLTCELKRNLQPL